jgi:hypothetical protein
MTARTDGPEPYPEESSQDDQAPRDEPHIDRLPIRLINAFVSPGKLMDQLAAQPKWVGMIVLTTVVSGVTAALVPADLIFETVRQQMIAQGVDVTEFGDVQMNALRYGRIPGAVIFALILQFGIAALYAVIFSFVLGDDGRYVQYLAAVSHGWFIPVLFSVLLLPLMIRTENLELRLTLDVFIASFFEPGLLRNVAKLLDLTVIWSILVIAQGAHAIDERRSFASAAVIMLTIFLLYALGIGLLQVRSIA